MRHRLAAGTRTVASTGGCSSSAVAGARAGTSTRGGRVSHRCVNPRLHRRAVAGSRAGASTRGGWVSRACVAARWLGLAWVRELRGRVSHGSVSCAADGLAWVCQLRGGWVLRGCVSCAAAGSCTDASTRGCVSCAVAIRSPACGGVALRPSRGRVVGWRDGSQRTGGRGAPDAGGRSERTEAALTSGAVGRRVSRAELRSPPAETVRVSAGRRWMGGCGRRGRGDIGVVNGPRRPKNGVRLPRRTWGRVGVNPGAAVERWCAGSVAGSGSAPTVIRCAGGSGLVARHRFPGCRLRGRRAVGARRWPPRR